MDKFKEEVANLLKPYLREKENADYLALKIAKLCGTYLLFPFDDKKED